MINSIEELHAWNAKLYPRNDTDGTRTDHPVSDKYFWSEFKIKSGPLFREAAWSHLPGCWSEDVTALIHQIQAKYGDTVRFAQIKEKFCDLTIYFQAGSPEETADINDMIKQCRDTLRSKGLIP